MSVAPEAVMSLLTSLGFDTGQSGTQSEMKIDTFDYWTNSDGKALLMASCACTVNFAQPVEAVA